MMTISNKNMFVSFLFSSTILVGLGPNLGITSTSSSLSSYMVNADFTCKTELDFHTWENEKEQRHIPGKQTFEQISTILMETFNEAYSDSNGPRMSSDTFASVSFVCLFVNVLVECFVLFCVATRYLLLLPYFQTLTLTHNTIRSVPSFLLNSFFVFISF
jgi:hypothetical protein